MFTRPKKDMLRLPEASAAYQTALDLCKLALENHLLARKLAEIAA